MSSEVAVIKKGLKEKRISIGFENTLKRIKLGKAEKVYLSSNCPEKFKEDIEYYSKISKTSVINLPYANDEISILCKKPFVISVLALLKGEK